jgi:hypothetical protein
MNRQDSIHFGHGKAHSKRRRYRQVPPARRRRMLFESLEDRRVLAVDGLVRFMPDINTLEVRGDHANNTVILARNPVQPEYLSVQLDNQAPTFVEMTAVGQINIGTSEGDDRLIVDTTNGHIPLLEFGRLTFDGGLGTDQVVVRDSSGRTTITNATPPLNGVGFVTLGGLPGTTVRFLNTEVLANQLGSTSQTVTKQIIGTGDVTSVQLSGVSGEQFSIDSFQVLVGGQPFSLQQVATDRGDTELHYNNQLVGTIVRSERFMTE